MGMIEIEEMEFYAFHGHYDVEKVVGNRFTVNLKIETDCRKAAESDCLADALDYQKAYLAVQETMSIPSDLLENVAQRMIDRIKTDFPEVRSVSVKVSKLNPPMGGQIGKVSVTMKG
jgi:dihydroneopterin aldolase